jgi:alginate O-acetyltransferase complex protein AlgI
MLFNSLHFLVFFPLVAATYFALPGKWRWLWLLLASCYFYMALIPVYILVLFFIIAIDFGAAMLIEQAQGARRRALLVLSLVANLSVLFVFKYAGFFGANVSALADAIGWNYSPQLLALALPVGLSFHAFQSMSYTIEVYHGRQRAERHPGIYALYVMFFPQLVAGPIERPQSLLPQLRRVHAFDEARVADGLRLMLWGLVKKVIVADRVAVIVNTVYGEPQAFGGVALILATYLFAVQIYCDFSGYSDIARGAARVLGIDLRLNFDRPYAARSVAEFWRRWHMSLSTWFRDYVYIPLGGGRGGTITTVRNVLIVFLLSGLWHGASWTFVAWGALHGLFLVASRVTASLRARVRTWFGIAGDGWALSALRWGMTFHLVAVAWIFFRAESLGDAFYVLTHLTQDIRLTTSGHGLGVGLATVLIDVVLIAVVLGAEFVHGRYAIGHRVAAVTPPLRWAMYYAGVSGLLFLPEQQALPFLYFQF